MSNSSSLHRYWQNTNSLVYQRATEAHTLTATGVWEISRSYDTGLQAGGSNLNNESVGYWNVANAAVRNESNSYTESSLASGIVRVGYDYKKRYFLRPHYVLTAPPSFGKDTAGDGFLRPRWPGT